MPARFSLREIKDAFEVGNTHLTIVKDKIEYTKAGCIGASQKNLRTRIKIEMFKSHRWVENYKITFRTAILLSVWLVTAKLLPLGLQESLKTNYKIALALALCIGVLGISESQAQKQKRIIQLSGVVMDQDSAYTLPGVHVYVPKAGRGTPTNSVGFFTMPVLVGDSVVFSSIGYQRQHTIIKEDSPEFMTVIVEMAKDATFLRDIVITPFPTEEVFKQAVLALNIPLDEKNIDKKALNAELLALMARTAPMDANLNYKYYMDQTIQGYTSKFQPPMNPFLNPFNWARFFRDLKKNKKK